jgi:hypothetical protein
MEPALAKSSPAALISRLGRIGLWLLLGLFFVALGLRPLLSGTHGEGALISVGQALVGAGLISGLWRADGWLARLAAGGAVAFCAVAAAVMVPDLIAGRTVWNLPALSLSAAQMFTRQAVLLAASLFLLGESLEGGRRR